MSDNIKVVVKVRPLICREIDQKQSYQWRVKNNTLSQLDQNGKNSGCYYTFDKVYDKETDTHEVYDDIAKPIVEAAIAGFNGTIFAYGQTSSGKTYTMSGSEESPGIITLSVLNLFEMIKAIPNRDFLVRVSYIEIYNETVKDLLSMEKKNIKIQDSLHGVKVDATERPTGSPEEVLEAMKEGEANRQTGATNMNEESSRSHSIFQITIESREHLEGEEEVGCVNVSQLNLVDLAGSERSGQTGATGLRFKEGTHINKSLSVLALVIKQLSEDPNKHANYRDSKLTRILQNSLGGNAKTSIICAITPASVDETISTLQFANRAKAIKNKPQVNAVATSATEIHSLTKQLSQLQSQLETKKNLEVMLESKRNVEQDNVNLQKRIATLQKLILNGFGQSNMEMMCSTRKKFQPPLRRMTIGTVGTLHPIQEDHIPKVLNFCTPTLKYNPMTLSASTNFLPTQSCSKLASLPEETRPVTPPPCDKKVNLEETVIEIDSDDDNNSQVKPCSPYHKCYNPSKTPPCVLRINAKQAEKNLKDIVELTEREKMYTPSVVELIEKLEQHISVIAKLEETVANLTEESKGKDTEMELLKNKIYKTEEEVKTVTSVKLDLESKCQDYKTRLTDWEVSYDTLKRKAKTREEELLSLLEEHKTVNKSQDISKLAPKPLEGELFFMDLSKDISLVNSDNESSTAIANEDDPSAQIQTMITDMQSQLTAKNEIIIELEANIFSQKQKIKSMESSYQDLQGMVDSFKEKLAHKENENSFLKSNIENLNSTLESQKLTLELANNDIKSYNSVIQELQIKLTKKDSILNVSINDSILESLIANEEKFIANNENMENIVQTFRMALDSRNKEIHLLKATMQDHTEATTDNIALKQEISRPIIKEEKLKCKETTKNLDEVREQYNSLKKQDEEKTITIEKLKEATENLTLSESEKEFSVLEISIRNNDLTKEIQVMTKKIADLEEDINSKNNEIKSLNHLDKVAQKYLHNAKAINNKLLEILLLFNSDNVTNPETIDNFDIFFNSLDVGLDKIDSYASQIIEEKKLSQSILARDKEELCILKNKHETELISLKKQFEDHIKERRETLEQLDQLTHQSTVLSDKLDKIHSELDSKNKKIVDLETKLNDAKKNNETLHNDLSSRNDMTLSLEMKVTSLCSEIESLSLHNTNLQNNIKDVMETQEGLNLVIKDKDMKMSEVSEKLKCAEFLIQKKLDEVISLQTEIDNLKHVMCEKQESNNEIVKGKLEQNNRIKDLEILLEDKQTEIDIMKKEIDSVKETTMHENETLLNKIEGKAKEIFELNFRIIDLESALEARHTNVAALTRELNDSIETRDEILQNILSKLLKLLKCDFNSEKHEPIEISCGNTFDQIVGCLDIVANRLTILQSEYDTNDIEKVISLTRTHLTDVTEKNVNLLDQFSTADARNKELLKEIENIRTINNNLFGAGELLEELKLELSIKTNELQSMELKARELKCQFMEFGSLMKQQMQELLKQNEILKHGFSLPIEQSKEHITDPDSSCSDVTSDGNVDSPSSPYFAEIIEKKSPQSLLTICCNRIIEQLQPNDNEYSVTSSSSKTNVDTGHSVTQVRICQCIELSEKLKTISEDNNKLRDNLKTLESLNQHLVNEQEETRKEIALLLEPAKELQKKIANHRTNLSTLTATTYAENKLLNSQLKVLKHHHTRYIHVCQKDLPAFKSQLYDLMTLLNGTISLSDNQNASFKRYSLPDVLDSNTTVNTFKNESVLDGDLLMLDTNVTLTTTDNTLLGHDQTCLETTQINFDNEVACQTGEFSEIKDQCLIYTQIDTLSNENQTLNEKLEILKDENCKLKEEIMRVVNTIKVDAQSSPIKVRPDEPLILTKLQTEGEVRLQDKLAEEVNILSQELASMIAQKDDIEKKYSDLVLEMPSTEALVRKINILEKECNNKVQEIAKLTNELHKTAKLINELQNENDTMSTQFMENISETDDLRKDLESLRDKNIKLTEKCEQLQLWTTETEVPGTNMNSIVSCPHCPKKEEIIHHIRSKHRQEQNSKLNRSLSDSDSSSRYNKIATLQQELHDSKEDCQKITQEVATIKNHLERSNLSMSQSMDLDESMGDGHIFNFTKDFDAVEPQVLNKFNLANIPEETDIYAIDKIYCINYYIEKTGAGKENLNCNTNIIDVMKNLYDNIVAKHGNDVENLLNRLRIVEESRNQLQSQMHVVNSDYSKVTKELDSKDNDLRTVTNALNQIRNSINVLEEEMSNIADMDKNNKLISMFKENLLTVIDTQFGLTSANIFEYLIDNIGTKHQDDLSGIIDKYTKLQGDLQNVLTELNSVTDNFNEVKSDLAKKETEYDLLKDQKQKVHEICNAVTLDIIKKEQDLCETITNSCQKLIELNVVEPDDIDLTRPMDKNLHVLLERLINEFQKHDFASMEKEKENLILETKKSYIIIEEKEQELDTLRIDLLDKEKKLEAQKSVHEDLNKVYEIKVNDNNANLVVIQNLREELNVLKENVLKKESVIEDLKCQLSTQKKEEASVTELKQQIDSLIQENENIKSINQMLTNEKENISMELQRSGETIEHNKAELERMAADILVLRESVKDNVCVIESLSFDAKSLMEHNIKLKEEFESKIRDCSKLEINMKTHEKTAEIQSRMIIRLQKQKDEDDKLMKERDKQLEELTDKCAALRKECEAMKDNMKTSKDEIEEFKSIKNTLEIRVSELEGEMETGNKHRLSIEAVTDNMRRRRQSIYDSQRMFNEEKQEYNVDNEMQAVFESRNSKPDDLFMDVDDEGGSGKSTPLRLSRGRDSFRVEHASDEEPTSRPSSVLATRRRRQSTHDLHRSELRHTPEPHDNSLRRLSDALTTSKPDEPPNNASSESEVSQLKERLATCEQELEELQQQYRELDEECETCAEYLRERDEQCGRLKRENTALEKEVKELREKVDSNEIGSHAESKLTVAHASVNTDEDWANLHAVVVDRMSFDAEVQKNKKLTRTIEELRYKKQELRNMLAKMQKALETHPGTKESRELEVAKSELKACRQELCSLRARCRELDEECDACGERLRERDAQCRRLRDAKAALETKLQELQDNASGVPQSVRKKRQSLHDQNRTPADVPVDTSTEISDDLLSYQVERDVSSQTMSDSLARELSVLRTAFDRVTKEKLALEHASTAQRAVCVATGSAIVQNQQLTDVIKENQKLKKINAKLIHLCKKRGKSHDANRENEEPTEQA